MTHAAKPSDNVEPTTTPKKMNHRERDLRPRSYVLSREREDETMKREKEVDICRLE